MLFHVGPEKADYIMIARGHGLQKLLYNLTTSAKKNKWLLSSDILTAGAYSDGFTESELSKLNIIFHQENHKVYYLCITNTFTFMTLNKITLQE